MESDWFDAIKYFLRATTHSDMYLNSVSFVVVGFVSLKHPRRASLFEKKERDKQLLVLHRVSRNAGALFLSARKEKRPTGGGVLKRSLRVWEFNIALPSIKQY